LRLQCTRGTCSIKQIVLHKSTYKIIVYDFLMGKVYAEHTTQQIMPCTYAATDCMSATYCH